MKLLWFWITYIDIIVHYNEHLNQFIQIMNGFLGNFKELQIIFGQILKIKENILIGYQINLILNQMKIGIILNLNKLLNYVVLINKSIL